jgi:hypothetical protein
MRRNNRIIVRPSNLLKEISISPANEVAVEDEDDE